MSKKSWTFGALVALLFAVAVLPYLQTLGFDFIGYDDDLYVTGNRMVREGLTWHGAGWAFANNGYASNWHPLTWLSLMTDVSLFGLSSGGMHFVNALLHGLNAVLVLLLLRRITGSLPAAFLAAACWAIHPLRMESVAWVSQRKDVLAGLFGLLAMLAYVRSLTPPDEDLPPAASPGLLARAWRHPEFWRILSAAGFALAFMAKPTVVTFPLLAALVEYALTGTARWRNVELLVWMCIVAIGTTLYVQTLGGAIRSTDVVPFAFRIPNAVASIGIYLRQTLLPTDLAVLYPMVWPIPWQHLLTGVAACLGGAAALWGCGFSARARASGPATGEAATGSLLPCAAGAGWFLIGLGPMLGLVQAGNQAHADRYTYWPSIGLALILAWGLARLGSRASRRGAWVGMAAAAAVTAALAAATTHQLRHWRNTETVFSQAIAVTSYPCVAHHNLGLHLCLRGRLAEGIRHLRQADVYRDGRNRSIRIDLAVCLALNGQTDEAMKIVGTLAEDTPRDPNVRLVYAMTCRRRQAFGDAERTFREILRGHPGDPVAWWQFGATFADQGHWSEAVCAWKRALELNPDFPPVEQLLRENARRTEALPLVEWQTLLAPTAAERAARLNELPRPP